MDILFYVFVAAFANIVGGLLIFLKRAWSSRGLFSLMALSAGILLSIALIDIIPESIEMSKSSPVFIILGFGLIYLFQQLLTPHNHSPNKTHKHSHGTSAGTLIGMLIHTFFDGISIVFSFQLDKTTGFVVLLAVLLHKIPEGLTISSIVYANYRNKRKAIKSAILLGISTILGAIAAVSISQIFGSNTLILAIALSITAGIFLYIATVDLLPTVTATKDNIVIFYFFGGILLYFAIHIILDNLPINIH
ncbi:ZIP family metal transporter [Solibacillus sp. CAU 1738]|uniref:ZIP family metal transporter n=1 Tax=Solibacillus sp. CAU 1738 TaxID=3140363 RepID=UPI00326062E0